MPTIDEQMNKFRLAGRGVFNQYFRLAENSVSGDAWAQVERFAQVERALFDTLVILPCGLENCTYHQESIAEIRVRLRNSGGAPAMINREISSGYWDHPIKNLPSDTVMTFVHYFDWDQTDYIDYRYARVVIDSCSLDTNIIGKHALVETQYIEFFQNTKIETSV